MITGFADSNNPWAKLAQSYYFIEKYPLYCHLLISGHRQKDGLDSDLTVTKPFIQVFWKANSDLWMA
jgi:hypothetical protein